MGKGCNLVILSEYFLWGICMFWSLMFVIFIMKEKCNCISVCIVIDCDCVVG